MKILRFLAAIFALALPATAQLVDYRALGQNGFYTNGFIVNSKYWTNQSGLYRYQPGTGPVVNGQRGPAFTLRGDGSAFVGTNVFQDVAPSATGTYFPYVVSMTDSNEPTTIHADWWALDSENYGVYGGAALTVQQGGSAALVLSGDTGTPQSIVTLNATPGSDAIKINDNGTDRFLASGSATNVITANAVGQNWVKIGLTNGVPTTKVRADGSVFYGKSTIGTGDETDFGAVFFETVTTVNSNEPPLQYINWEVRQFETSGALSEAYFNSHVLTDKDNPHSRSIWEATPTNGVISKITIEADPSNSQLTYQYGGASRFAFDNLGDLIKIKSVDYLWPATNGAASQILTTDGGSPQQLYWSTPSSGGITNSGVGPGTVNFIPKFITSTNITDSRVHQVETNQWNWNVRTNYAANTNSWTNRFYAEFTSTNNFQGFDIVANPPGGSLYDAIVPIRGSGNTTAHNKFRLWDSWDVNGIGTNASPDAFGHWLPVNDYSTGTQNGQDIGNGSKRVRDIFLGRTAIVTPNSAQPQFAGGSGGSTAGVGMTTDGTMLQFFRDTGITAAFNKANGAFVLDIAGNAVGFGTGISNVISGVTGSGLAGLVMMSPGTNSATVTPGTHGIIGVMATGADKSGGDLRLVGGSSTGVGTNGSVRIQTSEPALSTSSSLNNNFYDRLYVCAKPKVLTTNSATIVFNVTIPTADRMLGGEVTATTKISDGVDQASVRERFAFTAIRKGSTVTTAISASAPMVTLATGSAVLTTTWTAVANAQSVDIKCNAVTSGILSTNTFTRWSVELDSDAVPVISP